MSKPQIPAKWIRHSNTLVREAGIPPLLRLACALTLVERAFRTSPATALKTYRVREILDLGWDRAMGARVHRERLEQLREALGSELERADARGRAREPFLCLYNLVDAIDSLDGKSLVSAIEFAAFVYLSRELSLQGKNLDAPEIREQEVPRLERAFLDVFALEVFARAKANPARPVARGMFDDVLLGQDDASPTRDKAPSAKTGRSKR